MFRKKMKRKKNVFPTKFPQIKIQEILKKEINPLECL